MKKMLVLIPARGGSKGILNKNIKSFGGKPLIHWAIEAALQVTDAENICVSTDDLLIKETAEQLVKVPFLRPEYLARDESGMYEVLIHALNFYAAQNIHYDTLLLLQPTSPFRTVEHIRYALTLYNEQPVDMVVSVYESDLNPYYNLFEENDKGFLQNSKKGNFERRQDCPNVYAYNGAVYVINTASLYQHKLNEFQKIRKFIMSKADSIDLDTLLDWEWAEFLLCKKHGQL